jgi:hypothetical protein
MPPDEYADLVGAVKRLLDTIEHATIATVSSKGDPWNSPVFFARSNRTFFWISRADAQHSTNIRHNGRAFIAICDSGREDASGSAVYIDAEACEVRDEAAIGAAVGRIYGRRRKPAPPVTNFRKPSPQRIYIAVARHAWTNVLPPSGECPWDERIEIALDF